MPTNYKKIAEENIKKYGTDIGRYGPVLLAHLYSDRTHFIYEILQNAEDAGARAKKSVRISFHLYKNRLEIHHNGKLFDGADVGGICGLVEGTKNDDLTQIGKFGIGFKSVYAYTNTPKIYSGDEAFCIENYVQPYAIEKATDISADETLFVFPFNHSDVSPETAFDEISRRLREIGARTLLFLNHIEEIAWHIDGQEYGNYIRDIKQQANHKKVCVISKVGDQTVKDEEWLIFERPLQLNANTASNLKVEVAFKIEKDKNNQEIIVPVKDSKLIVFFPTEKPTYLNFLVQCPYRTTPTRENIPSKDNQNKIIIKETAELVSQSISIVKELRYLDINFLNVLPLKPDHCETEPIYAHIFNKVKEKLLSEELLPTSDGKYTKAADTVLARGKELTEFLDADDVQKLFSKKNWLDTNITYDKTRELRDYLINELKVSEVDFESFARKITAKFLESKSDEWMINFYGRLSERSDRERNILKTKPLIRLETGKHNAPFDEKGKVNVYLPAETKSAYPTVKPVLTENEDSMRFLKALGLTKPDLFAEIREFILPKYQKENPVKDERYFEGFEKLLKFYEDKNVSENNKREFKEELSKASFIDSVHNGTGEYYLKKPEEIYFNDKDLKDYFDGYPSVYFVSDALYEEFEEEKLKSFLMDLGVEDKPRRVELKKVADLSWEEKSKFVGSTGRDVYEIDYEYEGLENFIKTTNINKSCLLWKLLLKNIETLNNRKAKEFFEGRHEGEFRGNYKRSSFNAKFTETFKQQAWLGDKNNKFRKPSDITLSELPDDYIKESPNIDVLKKALGFKLDIIDQLPEDDRKKLELVKNLTPEELEKLVSEKIKKPPEKEEKTWIPEYEPNKDGVPIKEVIPDKIVTPDLTGQGEQIDLEEGKKSTTEYKATEENDSKTQPDKKAIGEWGEKQVYYNLKRDYMKLGAITETASGFRVVNASNEEFEVVWLNKDVDKGEGCDFIVKKNGDEIEYIEVKAKTQSEPELIEVTGTQWEFARKLYERGEGDKYFFYVVLNAGKENAQIRPLKNPVKLWKEGRLYAHPVNFKL